MTRPKALVAWSSGKDSAWALHELRRAGDVEVVGLLTTVTAEFGAGVDARGARDPARPPGAGARAPVPQGSHPLAVRERGLRARDGARARGGEGGGGHARRVRGPVPRRRARVPRGEARGDAASSRCSRCGGATRPGSPGTCCGAGLRAVLTCVDPQRLDRSFAGRAFDEVLLAGAAGRRRPVRRERGVPHLRLGGTDVRGADRDRDGRGGRARRLRLRGRAARPRRVRPAADSRGRARRAGSASLRGRARTGRAAGSPRTPPRTRARDGRPRRRRARSPRSRPASRSRPRPPPGRRRTRTRSRRRRCAAPPASLRPATRCGRDGDSTRPSNTWRVAARARRCQPAPSCQTR